VKGHPDLAIRAVRTLGKIETEAAAKMIGGIMSFLLTSEDARVRRAGMGVAGKATGLATSTRGAIANWLDSKDIRDRAAAARACGEIEVPWAEKNLRALLDDPHHLVRFAAKAALEAKAEAKEEEGE
jgi:HEAT repeat protein